MKLINIIPIHLFLQFAYATNLPEDDLLEIFEDCHIPVAGINWVPCGIDGYKCATLSVPLDYTDKYNENTTTLSLIKLSASKKPLKGSIIVNPGGPGVSGRGLLLADGHNLASIVGGHHDIISFDPRGTGETLPPFGGETLPEKTMEEVFSIIRKAPSNKPQKWMYGTWSYARKITESLFAKATGHEKYLGTAFAARDISEIANALGEGNQINYWGTSYGTVLGQVLADMFPDRIGRMLLDGNLLVDDYVETLGKNGIKDAEKALYHFYDECKTAGPRLCSSASKLPERYDFLEVFNRIIKACTGIGGYHELDESISALLNDDECNFELNIPGFASAFDDPQSFPPYWAILCSDATFRPKRPDDYFSSYRVNEAHSPFLNEFLLAHLPCVHWKARAAEHINLDRPETVHTKNPILLVNGAYDPVTPLGNARKISARFPGSQVVVHEGVGHGLTSHPSRCTREIVARYFIDGDLPQKEVRCKPDSTVFEYVASQHTEEENHAVNHKTSVLLWIVLGFLWTFLMLGELAR